MGRFYNVGDSVIVNWEAVENDGAVTDEMKEMQDNNAPNTVYTISRVDNTSAYPYVLEGYESIASFDEEELMPTIIELF